MRYNRFQVGSHGSIGGVPWVSVWTGPIGPKANNSCWGSMGIWWCPRWHKSHRRLNSKVFGTNFFDFQHQYFDNFDIDFDIEYGKILILSMEKF